MKIKGLDSFPPRENPFRHDYFNMGTQLGSNVTVMYANFSNNHCRYLIVVDTDTGERIKITFGKED